MTPMQRFYNPFYPPYGIVHKLFAVSDFLNLGDFVK